MPKPAKDVATGLVNKGFRLRQNDHAFYHLYVDGKKTIISTKISHGEKEIGDKLLGLMARQVRLPRSLFDDLVECPLTFDQYVALLRKSGVIGAAHEGYEKGR